MAEPQTAENIARALIYILDADDCFVEGLNKPKLISMVAAQLRDYARQQVETWRDQAARAILDYEFVTDENPLAKWTTMGGSYPRALAVRLLAIPVECP